MNKQPARTIGHCGLYGMTGQTYECENFVVVLWGYNTASKNLTAMCVHKRNGKSSLIYTGKGKNL